MAPPKVPYGPALEAWLDVRIPDRRSNPPSKDHAAVQDANRVRALARKAGVEPQDLTAEDIRHAPHASFRIYRTALRAWLAWLEHGLTPVPVAFEYTDADMHPLIVQWANELKTLGAIDGRACRSYKLGMHALMRSAGASDPADVTKAHVVAYIAERNELARLRAVAEDEGERESLAPSYVRWILGNISRFYAWRASEADEHGRPLYRPCPDPAARVPRPKLDAEGHEPVVTIATGEQVAELLAMCDDDIRTGTLAEVLEGRRMRALIIGMAFQGLRVGEAIRLDPAQVVPATSKKKARYVIPFSKTSKAPRRVRLMPALERELRTWGTPVCPRSWWPTSSAETPPPGYAHIQTWAHRHGLSGLECHSLRRYFATELHAKCGKVVIVSRMLGHSSTKVTERYIGLREDDLDRDLEDFEDIGLDLVSPPPPDEMGTVLNFPTPAALPYYESA